MSYLYAFVEEVEFDEELNPYVIGWEKVSSWNSLNLEEKKYFLEIYGKENLSLRFEIC